MTSTEFSELGVEELSKDDDVDVDDRAHKKLLNAVSSLYRKQRIAAPKRNEPSLQISEFNLTKTERKKRLAPTELLKGLSAKAVHQQIHSKIKHVKNNLKPLPKPLEKFDAEKITRETGYENVSKELSKWEATIQKNRAADQLIFPLRGSNRISMEPERDILATFSKPTELELKMAEVLNKSPTIKELKEEAEAEKLTLAQLIQRRNMIAKMRHRESYRIAKAIRQNKIKSKKYHRMLKRDKIKNELKEFELLQKTDPEAALAKLEKVERARAEERISLRHRNTGKWAKGLSIRAKYDAEARAQLADNLRKSRELTEKVKASMVSDSDDDVNDDDGDGETLSGRSASNPWVNPENEVASFVSGYRKFWEEQNKTKSGSDVVGIVKKTVRNTADCQESNGESENDEIEGKDKDVLKSVENPPPLESGENKAEEETEQIAQGTSGISGDMMENEGEGIKLNKNKKRKDSTSNKGAKPKHKKVDKKPMKFGKKRTAVAPVIRRMALGKTKIGIKSRKIAKPKSAGQSKTKIQFQCYENP